MSDPDQAQQLVALRTALGMSQNTMAYHLDLRLRDYQAFEWGECEIPKVYRLAAERIAITHAVIQNAPMMAPTNVREEALALARLASAS